MHQNHETFLMTAQCNFIFHRKFLFWPVATKGRYYILAKRKSFWRGNYDGRWCRNTSRSSTHQVRFIHTGFIWLGISLTDSQADPRWTTDTWTVASTLSCIESHRGASCRNIPAVSHLRLWSWSRHADSLAAKSAPWHHPVVPVLFINENSTL